MADTFTVRTADGTRYIESKFLKNANGNILTSPNAAHKAWNLFDTDGNFIGTNTNGYLIVPASLDIKTVIDFGRSLAAMGISANTVMIDAFKPGGWMDIQTNYNGMKGDNVPAYRAAASYLLGVAGAEAGYSLNLVKLGGGSVNLIQFGLGNVKDVSGTYFNSPDNVQSMTDGYNAQLNHIFNPSPTLLSSIFTSSSIVDANGGRAVDATFTGTGGSPLVIHYTVDPTGNNVNMSLGDPEHGVSTYQMIGGNLTSASQTDSLGYVLTTAYNYVDGQRSSQRTSAFDTSSDLKAQQDVFTNGTSAIKYIDNRNTHPYGELEIDKDATGKVTAAKPKLDGQPGNNVDFSAVGQVLGSALGRALAPNNQFGQIAVGTVAGAIGQKLAQAFTNALLTNATEVNFASAFANFDISLAGAGAGSVASFLVAELGHALDLTGFRSELFNASIGSVASGVANKVATEMLFNGLSFEAAIGTINFGSAAISAGYSISGAIGGYLGRELVPAQTHTGAVGGQLLGAVGSAVGISIALSNVLGNILGGVLNFIVPGLGSLIGTIAGTLIGDAIAPHPHPAAVDLIDQAGYLYGFSHSSVSASDGGDYSVPDPMATAAVSIINAYLNAVKGAALDHSKQTMVGYVTSPDFRYVNGWVPSHKYYSFVSPDDAVHAAALDVLQHIEVIGGDLLLKRAHANSSSSIPDSEPDWAGLTTPSSQSGAEKLVTMAGDLSGAQDYENYLNNREAINALIAAYPDKAFAAGWIATFARVNDLGLNHVNASDFLGGLVGYLDSVGKAGLASAAANASVGRAGNGSVIVEVKVAHGVEVPGALSVFADQVNIVSGATGQTVQFTVDGGLAARGYNSLGADAAGGDGLNDLWLASAGAEHIFTGSGGDDILVGGSMNDVIHGGGGWDFIEGGSGNDYLFGQDGGDILRGGRDTDFLFGGQGDDTYGFARGDGVDTVSDDAGTAFVPDSSFPGGGHDEQLDGGTDTLAFGVGISPADIRVQVSSEHPADLIVGVKDPAHPGVPFGQLADNITLANWTNPLNRIEDLRFADGTTLNIGAALGAYQVPFDATVSRTSIAENSPIGTVVGKVTGVDLDANAILSYSLVDDPYGRFAVNASTGEISVAGILNYEVVQSWPHVVRVADQHGNHIDAGFAITITDLNERPLNITLSGGSVAENSPGGTIVATAAGHDQDAGTAFKYSLTDNAGGRFVIHQNGEIAVVNSRSIDYEAASSHHITVRAADQYGLYVDNDFTLHITNVDEKFFAQPANRLAAFNPGNGWSSDDQFPRALADVNGDGMADIIGFGTAGVRVSLATGGGNFAAAELKLAAFNAANGWSSDDAFHRELADVNGDGKADIIGFGNAGVLVSLATGGGNFAAPEVKLGAFNPANGWTSQDAFHRELADVNGDGMADIIGFGNSGVLVSLATGGGNFAAPEVKLAAFNPANGWTSDNAFHRELADVNGDGKADIVGFGNSGVYVALATGGGNFAPFTVELAALHPANGWSSNDQFPRQLADINGDGMADIVGFGNSGVYVARATGGGHFAAPIVDIAAFHPANGWSSDDAFHRELADVNHDGAADIIGFGNAGVLVALANNFLLV